jgi:regulator of protease activity HflC (stomatin/prohibitin superfamily)
MKTPTPMTRSKRRRSASSPSAFPVQFQITNVLAWAYNNAEPANLLQDLATREVVHYLAGVDLNDVMSHTAWRRRRNCARQIQAAADEYQLGAKIIFVGLQDIHPPVKGRG